MCIRDSLASAPHSSSSLRSQISVKSCFIRGSVVRYVQLPAAELDADVLQDSTRTEVAKEQAGK
eukprot:2592141-Rhodomonas_salina.2